MTMTNGTRRDVAAVFDSARTIEGGGFEVYRPFPSAALEWLDPFLLLDEMAPTYHAPGQAIGAPAHPHRGFETVTYVMRGEVEHRDSAGNHGVIGAGDVQWMTAGDGIVHSEMPSARMQTEGGVGHGIQLWVNLPSELRRTAPRYQAVTSEQLPRVSGAGWSAEIIAGEFLGTPGPARTHTPIGVARVAVQPGSTLTLSVPEQHTAAVYAIEGSGVLGGGTQIEAHQLAVYERSVGDVIVDVPASSPASFDAFVLTGAPIGEPIARYGPFVMNTEAEIAEAIADFNAGRMGAIPATGTT